ncbi:MAG: Vancomycin B-type resistance protein VanW [Pelotomaculum sp. PtaB.Bin104]|nr:MAG: Vancomycin B-type resistance protein VanW [Pelotomaculum sp. PtaB.Bin104]
MVVNKKKNRVKNSRKKMIFGFLVVALIITPLAFLNAGFFNSPAEKVLPGVKVMGIDLGGLNKSEGIVRINGLEKDLRSSRVMLHYQNESWPLLLSEVGLDLNEESVMEAAMNAGRTGSLLQQWRDRKSFQQNGSSVVPEIGFDEEKLEQRVKELTKGLTVEPVDATFYISGNDNVTIVPAKEGIGVDQEKLKKELAQVLAENKQLAVELALVTKAPSRSTTMVEAMGVNGLLAGYFTNFDASKISRSYNINVAAKAFDEQIILPGQEVSFNQLVGPRSSEAGYKNAPVIVNDELVEGLGGGVCQVSTTLYNCVLLAGLEIVERYNHSLPVSYIPIGRDATVVYDVLDFKFRNSTDSSIFVKAYVTGGTIGFKFYGNTAYKRDVKVNTWVTQEIEPGVVYESDPTLPKGEQVIKKGGAKGFRVAGERIISLYGVEEKREQLPSSAYRPVNKVIAVGTLEVLAQTPPVSQTPTGGLYNQPPAVKPESRTNERQASSGTNSGQPRGPVSR